MMRIFFWDYERGTWQYDVFCLLIIAFIFLSPGSWFDNKDKKTTLGPPKVVKTRDADTSPLRKIPTVNAARPRIGG